MNWYAIYTKPKSEDMVSQQLMHAGIEVYNPKLRLKKYIRNQYRDMVEPLFPCYLFAKFEADTFFRMITYTRGVKKVVGANGSPWSVSEDVIDFIRDHEQHGFVSMKEEDISAGDSVRIADGPLAELTGIFKSVIRGTERVLLLLNAIGYQACAIVERASLRKV